MIVELPAFFNNPTLIELGPLKIQYYAVTWLLSALFINLFILFHNKKAYVSSICISAALMVILWSLSSLLTLQFPNGLIGLFIDLPWWLGGQLN